MRILSPLAVVTGVSCFVLVGATWGQSTQPADTSEREREAQLSLLVDWMSGSFDSKAQAAADPENYLDIRLEMRPIWPDRKDGRWLYVEQAAASSLERPYRQRVYRVSAGADGTFRSEVYELPGDPLKVAGAWKDLSKLAGLTPEQLTLKEGCTIILRNEGDVFVGSTQGTGCVSTRSGAKYATSEVRIAETEMRTWDRGFDAAGKQVWGAEKGPYVFKKSAGRK